MRKLRAIRQAGLCLQTFSLRAVLPEKRAGRKRETARAVVIHCMIKNYHKTIFENRAFPLYKKKKRWYDGFWTKNVFSPAWPGVYFTVRSVIWRNG
jgi:hypothetical protein